MLNKRYGFKSIDVIGLNPDHPEKDTLRQKFLAEHTHADFEVRFFVEGCGLFYLHANDKVYTLLCEKGDLISVPANTTHWFDMGTSPYFKCIRFFTTPEGWVLVTLQAVILLIDFLISILSLYRCLDTLRYY